VNVYEFDEKVINSGALKVRIFDKPSREWAMFVVNNRNRSFADKDSADSNHNCKYDIVVGPIANDDLALLFRQFAGGLIDADTLVKNMEYKKLTDQYSFHTEKALAFLRKVNCGNG
jgi:hypothetical protein